MAQSTTDTKLRISVESKENNKNEVPKGAKILKQDVTTNIEEIENGYLVSKNYEIKYELDKNIDWCYYSKKWFSAEDPMIANKGKSLADIFDTYK